uniref:Uncharacterized protein n=1 Tax=Strongyloides stercoralis TaxID=6248 RepID=A0AAF5DKF2_STRER
WKCGNDFPQKAVPKIRGTWCAHKVMKYQLYKLRSVLHLEILDHDKRHETYFHLDEAINHDKVYGPYFFKGTITRQSYLDLLQTQHSLKDFIFIQNGASSRYSKMMRQCLDSNFNERSIDSGSRNLIWSFKPPDLY